jgi:hypothetical protein
MRIGRARAAGVVVVALFATLTVGQAGAETPDAATLGARGQAVGAAGHGNVQATGAAVAGSAQGIGPAVRGNAQAAGAAVQAAAQGLGG